MAKREDVFKRVISHAKEYGYVFQSSEIYDGLSAVYDYGQNGAELKKNIREYWWRAMVQMNDNIVGLDSAIFMHPTTWKASGHVDAFNDPLIDNKDSKKRYRADVLVEDYVVKIEGKIEKVFAQSNQGNSYQDSTISLDDFKHLITYGVIKKKKKAIALQTALTKIALIDFFRDSFNDVPLTTQDRRSLFYKTYAESLSYEDWLEMDREDVTDLILPGDTE